MAGASVSGTGVSGLSETGQGVGGSSTSNYGVRGTTSSGPAGVMGQNQQGRVAVFGYTGPSDPPKLGVLLAAVHGRGQEQDGLRTGGVRGDSDHLAGVVGYSGPVLDIVPGLPSRTGVYGFADADATARGVVGSSGAGIGVHGQSTNNIAVYGRSTASTGVRAQTNSGRG